MSGVVIRDLSCGFKGQDSPVLSVQSAEFRGGEITLIAGPTGSGKSTLLRMVAGVSEGTWMKGDLLVYGHRRERLDDGDESVSLCPQNPEELIFHDRAIEEFVFGLENCSVPKEEALKRAEESFAAIGVDPEARISHLSGGKRALLMIESTAQMRRPVILLDEPLANLGIDCAIDLLKRLRKAAQNGAAVVVAEHRLHLVLPFVDRIYSVENKILIKKEKSVFINRDWTNVDTSVRPVSDQVLISVDNLSVSYGNMRVLSGVNLTVHRGERIVILGHNGAGKTTLLDRISGLERVRKKCGTISSPILGKVGSRRWFSLSSAVFQNPVHQLFRWTLRDEVRMGAKSESLADRYISELKLDHLLDRHPLSLSEGEKRRATIACALAKDPQVIFLDEPTVGQDPESLEVELEALDRRVSECGTALVTVTHDMGTALSLSDSAYLLEDGKLASLDGHEGIRAWFEILERRAVSEAES